MCPQLLFREGLEDSDTALAVVRFRAGTIRGTWRYPPRYRRELPSVRLVMEQGGDHAEPPISDPPGSSSPPRAPNKRRRNAASFTLIDARA